VTYNPSTETAALASEINSDPAGLGYAALKTAGNDAGIAALLNALTGAGTGTVFLTAVNVQTLILALKSTADWDLLTTSGNNWNSIQLLTLVQPLDCSQTEIQTLLSHVFSGLSANSITALTAAIKRTGSRAEVLFGAGSVIQNTDVAHALGRG
jgi:hypothetical protein